MSQHRAGKAPPHDLTVQHPHTIHDPDPHVLHNHPMAVPAAQLDHVASGKVVHSIGLWTFLENELNPRRQRRRTPHCKRLRP